MKGKLFVILILVISTFSVEAQSFTNKKGDVVTPETGDWALGFDAAPVFNYFGNLLNGNTSNSINPNWAGTNNSIYGKYFDSEDLAYRGSFRLMTFSQTSIILTDTHTVGVTPVYITDFIKSSGAAIVIGAGFEKHKSKGRLHGLYGAEFLLTYGGTTPNMRYIYDIEMNKENFDNFLVPSVRTLSTKAGATTGFGIRGFIGIEYYVFPKISIGAEYGWGFVYEKTSNGKTTKEKWGLANIGDLEPSRYEVTTETGGNNYFGIDTDINAGAIKLMFHF